MTDLHRLAEEFPARFKRGIWEVKFRVGDTWFSVEPEGNTCVPDAITEYHPPYGSESLDLEISAEAGQALLHAALVELVESAGLRLIQWGHTGFWNVQADGLPVTGQLEDTPLEAVLAAADEIKRRLQEVTT